MDTTELYVGLGLAACALAFVGRHLLSRRPRTRPDANAILLDAIIAQQSPDLGRQHPATRASSRSVPDLPRSADGGPQLAALEGHLRNAVLNANARERLVKDAMRVTRGDRVAAIRKVLRDLHEEDARWS